MLKILKARFRQRYRTVSFPRKPPVLPDEFRGRPIIDAAKCGKDCGACVRACPVDAIKVENGGAGQVDLGRCLFCRDCADACPYGAVGYSRDYRLAAGKREDLIVNGDDPLKLAQAIDGKIRKLFGRSFKLREVSAGGCNACEADVNVLNTVVFDLGRFGIQFVASPRHADGILVTGCVSENMRAALLKTYEATPSPKWVIAVGACAISGGPYVNHSEVHNGIGNLLPVDLLVPGCPPHPVTILDGLLRLLGRIKSKS